MTIRSRRGTLPRKKSGARRRAARPLFRFPSSPSTLASARMRMLLQKVPRAALRPHLHRITICPVRASVLESLLGGSVVRVHEDAPVCVGVGVGVGVGGCGWVCACVSVHVLHVCMHARKRRRLLFNELWSGALFRVSLKQCSHSWKRH